MDPQQRIDFLKNWLHEGSVGVEVGVWKGDFSRVLVDQVKPRRLFLVDPWEFQPDFPQAWYGGGRAMDQGFMDGLFEEVSLRFLQERDAGQVEIVRARSSEADVTDSLDWVYIDGNHTYEAVLADIAHWSPKLVPGGVLALDDYGDVGWWEDGVTRAAAWAVEQGHLELLAVGGTQAILRVPSAASSG